jgi:phage terminase large subunit
MTVPSLNDPSRELAQRLRDDPVFFALVALGVRCWSRQREMLEAAAAHNFVLVRSGHKVSKSTSLVILALWWALTRARAVVVLSATSGEQIGDPLWLELRRVYDHAPAPLGGVLSPDWHKGLRFSGGRRIFGKKPEDHSPESFAGTSAPGTLMYLIDEASGFPDALIEAAMGNLAGGGKMVATSNPTRTSGWYYDGFHAKAHLWHPVHISSLESPNITGREAPVPGLATRAWEERMAADYGRDSPAYSVRVEGNFPKSGTNTVNNLELVEAAVLRHRDPEHEAASDGGELRFGLDVGRTGDDPSVLSFVRGKRAYRFEQVHGQEGDVVAGWVLNHVRDAKREGDERPLVRIDVIGWGASVYDHLKHSQELRAVPVNVSTRPNDGEKYAKKRDELWFAGRMFLREGGSVPDDPELHGDLLAAHYTFDAKGRYVVEDKDGMKKRLKRSPNKGDAFNLAVSNDPPQELDTGVADDFANLMPGRID